MAVLLISRFFDYGENDMSDHAKAIRFCVNLIIFVGSIITLTMVASTIAKGEDVNFSLTDNVNFSIFNENENSKEIIFACPDDKQDLFQIFPSNEFCQLKPEMPEKIEKPKLVKEYYWKNVTSYRTGRFGFKRPVTIKKRYYRWVPEDFSSVKTPARSTGTACPT